MALKIILIVILLFLVILVALPLLLRMAGVSSLQPIAVVGGALTKGEGTVVRSEDGGREWEQVTFFYGRGVQLPARILDIAFHPRDENILYLGTKSSAIWRSADRGKTWSKVEDSSRVLRPDATVLRVAISRSRPETLYAGVFQEERGRVLRSDDGGKTFREVWAGVPESGSVVDLFVDPRDAGRLVIATGQGGILISQDGGARWRVIQWFGKPIIRLAVNPAFPQEMFVLTAEKQLRKTFDGGENWADLDLAGKPTGEGLGPIQGFPNPFFTAKPSPYRVESFAVDPDDFTRVYAGGEAGFFRSFDGGFTWIPLALPLPPEGSWVTAIGPHPGSSGQRIFVGIRNELYRSDDAGSSWSARTLPVELNARDIAIHPLSPDVMFAIMGR